MMHIKLNHRTNGHNARPTEGANDGRSQSHRHGCGQQDIINRLPRLDERKTRADFRKVTPKLCTVVIHCFDPRATSGIP